MKKIITLFGVLFCSNLLGQGAIKIGDIEISEKLAEKYFIDLYLHPDSSRIIHLLIGSYEIETEIKFNPIVKFENFRKDERGDSMVDVFRGWNIKPREPSASDFAKWFIKYKKENH